MFDCREGRFRLASHLILVVLMLGGLTQALLAPRGVWAGGQTGPAQFAFQDLLNYRLRSDSGNVYVNTDCVVAQLFPGGTAWLRTATRSCQDRSFTIDLSEPIGTPTADGTGVDGCHVQDSFQPSAVATDQLNICGLNLIRDAKFSVDGLFQNSSLTSGAAPSLFFNLAPNFDHWGFQFKFEAPLRVSLLNPANPSSGRIITGVRADTGDVATAELLKFSLNGNKIVAKRLGRYRVPFEVSVARQP